MDNNEGRYTDKYRLDANWIIAQWNRPDGEERLVAFYESIRDALISDDECWDNVGRDVFTALVEDDPTALLIALCGWGPKILAQRAQLMRGRAQYQDEEIPGTLMVDWDDDQWTSCQCVIQREDHMIAGLDYRAFTREDAPRATIQNVFVRFAPFDEENTYDFRCVSQVERDAADDNEIFWYPPKEVVV